MNILLFASLKDLTGKSRIELELEETTTVSDLSKKLAEEYPKIEPLMKSVRIAVNQDFADGDDELKEGDEIAILPPVSGG